MIAWYSRDRSSLSSSISLWRVTVGSATGASGGAVRAVRYAYGRSAAGGGNAGRKGRGVLAVRDTRHPLSDELPDTLGGLAGGDFRRFITGRGRPGGEVGPNRWRQKYRVAEPTTSPPRRAGRRPRACSRDTPASDH